MNTKKLNLLKELHKKKFSVFVSRPNELDKKKKEFLRKRTNILDQESSLNSPDRTFVTHSKIGI